MDEDEKYCEYISINGIRKSCNITSLIDTCNVDDYNFNNLKEYDTLFIKSDKLNTFSKIINTIKVKFILVSGSSDYTTPINLFSSRSDFLKFVNNDNLIHWFCQNCISPHSKITKLPIGLDYHTLSYQNYKWGDRASPINQEKILLSIKNNSTPFWEREMKAYSNFQFQINTKYAYDRIDAINMITKEIVYYEPHEVNRINTWNNQINYAFVVSPHGNGLDCHRTWEALILGCIPIVKTSLLDNMYDNLPVLIVNSWKDVTRELLTNTVINFKERVFYYEKLTLKYWLEKFKSHKNDNIIL